MTVKSVCFRNIQTRQGSNWVTELMTSVNTKLLRHYTPPLHTVITHRHYTPLLHTATTHRYYTQPLHAATTYRHNTQQLNTLLHPTTLNYTLLQDLATPPIATHANVYYKCT